MFLVDNLLLGPGKAAMVVFKELARKAQAEWLDDDAVKQELQEIYALAEAGKISTPEFEARECRLLERLEQIARAKYHDKWGPDDTQVVIDAETVTQPLMPPEPPPALPVPAMEVPVIEAPVITPPPIAAPPPRPIAPPPISFAAPEAPKPPSAPPAPLAPQAPQAPLAPPAPPAPRALTMNQVIESSARALALLNLKLSVITSVSAEDGGWRVCAELVERRGVPDTNDLIGVYELRLDAEGNATGYERTRLRRRGDIGR